MGDPSLHKSENGTILDPSGRVRLGLSFTTAGSCNKAWPIRVVEKTRSDTRPHGLPVGSGTGVAAHPVAQLTEQITLARSLQQTPHRPHHPRTRTFHTIYDRWGNRTNVVKTGTAAGGGFMPLDGIAALAYDNATNRITTSGYQYDVNGNMIRSLADDGTTWVKYEYDAANRLNIIRKDDTGQTQLERFQYDSTNARVQSHDFALDRYKTYVNAGGTTLAEFTEFTVSVPVWTKSYTYLGGSQLSTITPNGQNEYIEFNHPDRLGVKTVTNQSTGTSSEQAHLPFGTALNAETSPPLTTNNKRFTSYDRSEKTKLDYAVNRTYDSKLGRFTQVDPIGMSAASLAAPQTLNMYSYCGNDPVNYTDPSGLFWGSFFKWLGKVFKWIMIAVTIAVAILTVVGTFMTPIAFAVFMKTAVGQVLGFIAGIPGLVGKFIMGVPKMITGIFTFAAETSKLASLVGAAVLAGGAAVGAIANAFQNGTVPLTGDARKQWDTARFVLLSVLNDTKSKCFKFLKSKGFDPAAIAKDLQNQTPNDGFLSTNPEDFGAAGASPKEFFEAARSANLPLDAATAPSGNIYYGNARGGIRASLVLHENLHRQVPGVLDDALGQKLGTWKSQKNRNGTSKDSAAINKTLEKNGCK